MSLTVGLEARERLGLFFVVRLEPGYGPRALRIAPAAAIRLQVHHGGTFVNPGDG